MGSPQDAPPFTVLCIGQVNKDRGRSVIRQYDFYVYYPEGYWQGADERTLITNLLLNVPMVAVKQGDWAKDEEFRATVHRALTDPDLPPVSATSKDDEGGKEKLGIDG
jgi:hypothetical protein